jgi:broad specificity phosphatase PhoE
MKIFFIRHGETTGDVENLYGGIYDDHLSPKGRDQAQRLAIVLKDKGIERIFSSPLIRAKETA